MEAIKKKLLDNLCSNIGLKFYFMFLNDWSLDVFIFLKKY